MYLRTSLVVLASVGALLLAAPASADPWGADQVAAAARPDAFERALAAKAKSGYVDASASTRRRRRRR